MRRSSTLNPILLHYHSRASCLQRYAQSVPYRSISNREHHTFGRPPDRSQQPLLNDLQRISDAIFGSRKALVEIAQMVRDTLEL